jgi:hypothetical protein
VLSNIVVETFLRGGWVMWPILATFFLSLCVVLDRAVWWLRLQSTLQSAKQDQARDAIGTGDFPAAWNLTRNTADPFLINLGEGMTHAHTSMLAAMQLDATHLIGVGKQSTRGGLKIALFNVTDVHNPQLVGEKRLGGYGSDSEVLTDHKAFLFDREKDLLVLPVHIVEDATSSEGIHPIWGGAYVFGVNPLKGFNEKGIVIHYRDDNSASYDVKRSFYIENILYTMARDKIVMSDLKNGTALIGAVELGQG